MTTARPVCYMCGKDLRLFKYRDEKWAHGKYGYNGDGVFCRLACGYNWALIELRERGVKSEHDKDSTG